MVKLAAFYAGVGIAAANARLVGIGEKLLTNEVLQCKGHLVLDVQFLSTHSKISETMLWDEHLLGKFCTGAAFVLSHQSIARIT